MTFAKLLPPAARALQANPEHNFRNNAIIQHILTLIEQRCALTIQRLAAGTPQAEQRQQTRNDD